MSTKALREALKELGYHATTDCQSAAGAEETQRKLDAAVEELNAIERAAKALDDAEVVRALRHAPEDIRDAMALVRSIAEGAP